MQHAVPCCASSMFFLHHVSSFQAELAETWDFQFVGNCNIPESGFVLIWAETTFFKIINILEIKKKIILET